MATTTFERLGGFARIRRIVSDFYDRVLDSEVLQHHFDGIDMRRLIDHQTKFISSVMGGPIDFNDTMLERAHARLGITRDEFREMNELMRETLEDAGIDEADIEAVCGEISRREPLIVSKDDG